MIPLRRTGNGPGSSGHIYMHKLDGLSLVDIYGTLTYNTVGVVFWCESKRALRRVGAL